jgi:autotransporter-associated beta strand protein
VKSLIADYGSTVTIGGEDAIGVLTATDSLKLGFGARLKTDLYSDGLKADQMNTVKLIVETKNWQYGPEYKQPVMEFVCHFVGDETKLRAGKYLLGSVGTVAGDVADIKIEGISKVKATLVVEDGTLVLNVEDTRNPADIEWSATLSNIWDVATTENFVTYDAESAAETFIEGDNIYFTDNAQNKNVVIANGVEVKPANIYFTGSEAYTLSGEGKIVTGTFHHSGSGTVTMGNDNTYTGGNHLTGGTTVVSSLSSNTQAYGNLGGVTKSATDFTIENGAVLRNTATVTNGSPMRMVGTGIIKTDASFAQQAAISGDTLVKTGGNTLSVTGNLTAARTIVKEGTLNYSGNNYSKTVELQGTSAIAGDGFIPSPIYVAPGAKATLTLTNTYYKAYSGALTGSGQLTINPTNTVSRVAITGNWTGFTGTIVYNNTNILMPLKNSGLPNATLSTGANTNIGIAASSDNASVTYPIGKLTGSGTLRHKEVNFGNSNGVSGNVTWKVGSDDLGNFTFSGSVYDAGGSNKANFEKVGNCTMTVGGSWQNSGTVKVSEGTLVVTTGKTLGTGALTVAEGATLMGLSSTIRASSKSHGVTNSSVTINGDLRTGTEGNSTTGYWYFDKHPLTIGATGRLFVGINKCSTSASVPGCSHLWSDDSNGSITFKDGATVCVYLASSYDPAASIGTDEAKADSFMVFNFAKATVGDVQFELPELPEGYYWDTTNFKNGYLYIRYMGSAAIQSPLADMDPKNVYDLNGRLVRRLSSVADMNRLPAGIYIRGGRKVVVR